MIVRIDQITVAATCSRATLSFFMTESTKHETS